MAKSPTPQAKSDSSAPAATGPSASPRAPRWAGIALAYGQLWLVAVGPTNPVQIQKFLRGIDYPADKQTLVECAHDNGADDEVLRTLEDLPMDRS